MAHNTDLSNLDSQVHKINGAGALLIPVGTKSQRPLNPQAGMLRWNSSINNLELYGTSWNELLNKQQIEDRFVDMDDPKMNADLDMQGHKVINTADPSANGDVVNLGYLEARFTAGTGINADTLDGNDSFYFATQYDVTDLQNLVADVQQNVDDHIADTNNPHQVTKDQIGLGSVSDIPPADMPISDDTQAALDTKVNKAGDTMDGALSMGYNNLVDIMNFVGMVVYFATPTAPTGFLVCNGAAVSRSAYSRLFDRIGTTYGAGNGTTTFNVPDLRGMFVRGWAPGGYPTDPGRTLGSFQDQMLGSHNHTYGGGSATTSSAGAHTHVVKKGISGGWGGDSTNDRAQVSWHTASATDFTTSSAGAHTHTFTIPGGTTSSTGGAETRPINRALLACIMY